MEENLWTKRRWTKMNWTKSRSTNPYWAGPHGRSNRDEENDSTKILNYYDVSTFTPQISLCVPIFSFLSAKLFELGLKSVFSSNSLRLLYKQYV